jgi:hypothetical protein
MKTKGKKIIVLAGNFREFNIFLEAVPAEEKNRYIYADFPDRIMGIEAEKVLEIGTCYKKPNHYKLLDLARTRVR